MTEAAHGFPKRLRLRKRREYLRVQRGGGRVTTRHFVVFGRPNRGGPMRLGITVSKKVGKAHVRNRVKRLVREAFRLHRDQLPKGLDVVLVAKKGKPADVLTDVVDELIFAAGRLRAGEGSRGRSRKPKGARR